MNEFIIKIADFIQNLNKKEFQRYLIIALSCIGLLMGSVIFYIYRSSSHLVAEIKKIERFGNKAAEILSEHEKLQKEEERIQVLLDKYKNFDIQGDFEQFFKEQNIVPEAGWGTTIETINPKFDEIILSASFRNQTTQKLVEFLQKLDEKEIVYIKNLTIRSEKNKKITFDISIATKKRR